MTSFFKQLFFQINRLNKTEEIIFRFELFFFIRIINSLQVIELELSWKCSYVTVQILNIIFFLIPRSYEMRIIWNIAWNYLKIKYKTNYFGTTWIRIEKVTFAHFNSVRKYNWRNCKKNLVKPCEYSIPCSAAWKRVMFMFVICKKCCSVTWSIKIVFHRPL